MIINNVTLRERGSKEGKRERERKRRGRAKTEGGEERERESGGWGVDPAREEARGTTEEREKYCGKNDQGTSTCRDLNKETIGVAEGQR